MAHPEQKAFFLQLKRLYPQYFVGNKVGEIGSLNINGSCREDVWGAESESFGAKYLSGVSEDCLNQTDLRGWLRNAPAMKPMYANPALLTSTGGKYRGMPNLGLTETDIEKLVAYLLTLK